MSLTRILVVEDETIVAMDVKNRLTDLGYEVTGVADRGAEALELAGSTRPDLVLMDIQLKGEMDGITAAEEIRQRWRIPVIYLTAFSEESTLQRAKVTEPFGYIIKPFEDREIQSAIEMALYKHQAEERLRDSERRYATTLTSIGDGVIATDPQGAVTFMNPVAEKLTGWSLAEAQGRPLAEVFTIVNEQTRQAVEDPVARVLREGRVVGLANHTILISRDGRETPIDDCAAPIRDELGQVTGSVLVFQDGSERKRAEEALRASEEKYRLIAENTSDLISILDMNLCLTYVSPAIMRFRGLTVEEAMEQTLEQVLTPESIRLVLSAFKAEMQLEASGTADPDRTRILEVEEYKKDRSIIWVEANVSFLRDKNRKPVAFLIVSRDITKRRQVEADLRRAHQTFLTVLDGIDATIYAADMDTHEILFMNKHMVDDFGAGLTGRKCHEVFREQSEPCGLCTNGQLLDVDGNPTGVCVWESKNPITGKCYINNDRAIRWVDGRMVRLQIATDISKLKELEKERGRIEEQLQQSQKMESVGRLAGGVAHDFNNMLSAILGHTELAIMKDSPSGLLLKDLKAIEQAAQRSADLTRQLLAFARKQTVEPKVLDFNDTVSGMLKLLLRLIGEDIDLVWMPGAGLWPVKIDPSQIDQLLANLCVNARDAIAGVGKVTIETENIAFDEAYCAIHPGFACGEYVMLAVSDDGCGMKKEVLDHLFEPFFTTKEVGTGTGLGLAMVYGIVKQNEGFINVYSEPDTGTTFKIYLPRFVGDAVEPISESPAETPRGHGEIVLLVEDEAAILNLGREMLETLGYTVITAGTPGEALRHAEARASEIELLMTDVVMPEMNGRNLAKSIHDIKPGLKCLFTSGYTANVIAHHGVLDKGLNFLQKPFSLKELASKVRQALERD